MNAPSEKMDRWMRANLSTQEYEAWRQKWLPTPAAPARTSAVPFWVLFIIATAIGNILGEAIRHWVGWP